MLKTKSSLLICICFLILSCSKDVDYVSVEDSLVPISLTYGESRVNTGSEAKFSLKSNRNVYLVADNFSDGYRTFEYGGSNYNKNVLIRYLVSESNPNGPHLIVSISSNGSELYEFGRVPLGQYIILIVVLFIGFFLYFFRRYSS